MFADFEEVKKMLVCPRSGCPLVQKGDSLSPLNDGKANRTLYRFVRGQPVLVDFEDSLLNEEEIFVEGAVSALPRKQGVLRKLIKAHLLHPDANRRAGVIAGKFLRELKQKREKPKLLMIGAGGGGRGTDVFYDDQDARLISFDIYASPLTHFVADAHKIPIETASVDGVWIQYVLEHVLEPWRVVSEIKRVLVNEGLVYAETPFLQQVHEGAYDFVRFTYSGHRWLFRDFIEIESGISMGPGVQLLWTLEHNARGVFRSRAIGQAAKLALFWLQFLERMIPLRYAFDNASSFYFFGAKTDKPLTPQEIVRYYKGAL